MEIGIFDVVGPIMVGPSSSHTAGAARLGRVSRLIAGKEFHSVRFALHGSFAQTYKGHGTDIALLAGVMGMQEDDERIACAFAIAKERGIQYEFCTEQLEGVHENTVKITYVFADGTQSEVVGSSTGGGQICICSIDGFPCEMTAGSPTLVVTHYDRKGVISDVTRVLAEQDINIAVIKLSRKARGGVACAIIETDSAIAREITDKLRLLEHIIGVQAVNVGFEEE